MGIWTHSLKFNLSTGGIHQLPQTTGDGIHSLLQGVVWDVGDNVPNPVLQLLHCAKFCPVHFLICPSPTGKSHRAWDLDFLQAIHEVLVIPVNVPETSDPTRHYAQCKVWRCAIVPENKFIDVFPARYDSPHVIFQHLKIAFGIHGVTQKICADDPSGRHSAPHGHFWTILHLLHCPFWIVCRPVMAIMTTDETLGMEKGLVAPQNAACSNLRSFLNTQAASHLCCHCACCLSLPLPTPSTGEL